MAFDTPITLAGPLRAPVQMLAEQSLSGGVSVHDDAAAANLGLAGAPIEGPTHFSQFDPLGVHVWGRRWFEEGCISTHFLNMVVEGEQVRAALTPTTATRATIGAEKADNTPVLSGTASVGTTDGTDLDERRRRGVGDPGDLHIIDRIEIGMDGGGPRDVTMGFDEHNGPLYPFTLAQKLDKITEPCSWYLPPEDGGDSPWGDPIVPTEMLSVLAFKAGPSLPIRRPSLGLFIDLEVRYVQGPVFVGRPYRVEYRVVGRGQSRRVESWWTEATITDSDAGSHAATVLLHQGVFKASYPDYPADAT
ncbi:MAG: hypothetical protein HKN44_10945 [Ilumatobacter sp.]|nr:hypothetical protein [Ilumatobacter sp.]